jgi:hypothetical protein
MVVVVVVVVVVVRCGGDFGMVLWLPVAWRCDVKEKQKCKIQKQREKTKLS